MREAGWYWVKDGGMWEPLWFNGLMWDGQHWGHDLQEIGPRIPAPDEAPPIGTRYRDETGEVVAIVAPRYLPLSVFDKASKGFLDADYHSELGRWVLLHDAIPEPSNE